MSNFILVSAFALTLNTAMFVWVLSQPRLTPLNRSFLYLISAVGLVLIGELTLNFPLFDGWEMFNFRFFSLFWVPLGFLFLEFVYRLLKRRRDWVYFLAIGSTGIGMVLASCTDLVMDGYIRMGWGVADTSGPLHVAVVLVPATWVVMGIALLGLELLRTHDLAKRGVLKLLLVGSIGANGAASTLEMVFPDLLGMPAIPRLGGSALVVFILFVFIAAKRHHFLTISVDQVAEELFFDVHEGVVLIGKDGAVLRMNPAARRLLDVEREDQAAERLADLARRHRLDEEFREAEVDLERDGSRRTLTLSQSVSRRDGLELGKMLLIRDVTEARRAEQLIRRSRDELEREIASRTQELRHANQMEAIGTLAGGIAHDFNNFLAAILGFSTAARDDLPADHPVRDDLQEVLNASYRARDLTKQILTLSRRDGSDYSPVDVPQVVREALRLFEVSMSPGIELSRRLDESAGVVMGDPTQLHQVIVNLCRNADHAIGSRSGEITVTVEASSVNLAFADSHPPLRAGDCVVLTFRDTGDGMSPEVLERIFEPYFTTKSAGEGTGLGLATAFGIVQNHGGTIVVESEPGHGAAFSVYLPLAEEAQVQGSRPRPDPLADGPDHSERILVVDDEAMLLRMIKRVLGPLGYQLETCQTGAEAYELFRRDPTAYQLVITDQMMPEMTGLVLTEKLLAVRSDLPVLMLTGRADGALPELAKEVGIRELLSKPVAHDELRAAVERALSNTPA